jgi:hypothetical protein
MLFADRIICYTEIAICITIIMFLDIIYRLKCPVYILDKDETMDNVQERNNCTNLPSSQTLRS